MNTRIRYKQIDGNKYQSIKVFTSSINNANYTVFLDLSNYTFKIRNESSKTFTSEGGSNINNLNVLKRAAKRELERLGVRFSDEGRLRSFGLCEKGYSQKKHLNKQPPIL